MSYRIKYAVNDGMLRAVVSGRASLGGAASIAQDISREASRQAVKKLIIDLRSLLDRVGTLGTLLAPEAIAGRRVAVIDVSENDPHYVYSESAARVHGADLRYFYDPADALSWLRECAGRRP